MRKNCNCILIEKYEYRVSFIMNLLSIKFGILYKEFICMRILFINMVINMSRVYG